jgi:pilus assembly protein Flp/PilA
MCTRRFDSFECIGSPLMNQLLLEINRFVRREEGQDLLEYGLLAVLIAILAMGAVTTLGTKIDTFFWRDIAQNF